MFFRNLVITDARYEMKFEDKTYVEMANATFSNPVFIDVYNSDNAIMKPSVKIMDCVFPGKVDISNIK